MMGEPIINVDHRIEYGCPRTQTSIEKEGELTKVHIKYGNNSTYSYITHSPVSDIVTFVSLDNLIPLHEAIDKKADIKTAINFVLKVYELIEKEYTPELLKCLYIRPGTIYISPELDDILIASPCYNIDAKLVDDKFTISHLSGVSMTRLHFYYNNYKSYIWSIGSAVFFALGLFEGGEADMMFTNPCKRNYTFMQAMEGLTGDDSVIVKGVNSDEFNDKDNVLFPPIIYNLLETISVSDVIQYRKK